MRASRGNRVAHNTSRCRACPTGGWCVRCGLPFRGHSGHYRPQPAGRRASPPLGLPGFLAKGERCTYSKRERRLRAVEATATARTGAMITITDKAALKVKEIAETESLLGQGLRLRVMGGGCAGFTYDLYFEDKLGEMDEEFESNGVK